MATYGDFSGVTDDPKETDIKMILEKECHFTDPVAMQLFKTYQSTSSIVFKSRVRT